MDFPEFLTLNLWFRPTWAQQSKGSNSVCLRSIISVTSQRTQNISLMLALKSIWLKQYLIYFFCQVWTVTFGEELQFLNVLKDCLWLESLKKCWHAVYHYHSGPPLWDHGLFWFSGVQKQCTWLISRSRLADINIFCLQSHQELPLTVVRSVVLSLIRDDWSQAYSHYYANRDGFIIKKLEITFHTYLIYY